MDHSNHPIYTTSFATVHLCYVKKAERKGRTKDEVDTIICWLTGYTQEQLDGHLEQETHFQTFFDQAPQMHPHRGRIY